MLGSMRSCGVVLNLVPRVFALSTIAILGSEKTLGTRLVQYSRFHEDSVQYIDLAKPPFLYL